MADEKTPSTTAAAAARDPKAKTIRVDLHNPTRATRIIDAADEAHTKIMLNPGETKRNVEVAEWVVRELKQRTRGSGKANADLHVYKAGEAPDPSSTSSTTEDDGDGDDE